MKLMTAPKPHSRQVQHTVEKKMIRTLGEMCLLIISKFFVLLVPTFYLYNLVLSVGYSEHVPFVTPIPRIVMISLVSVMMLGIIFSQKHIMAIYLGFFVALLALPIAGVQMILPELFYWSEGSQLNTSIWCLLGRLESHMSVFVAILMYILLFCAMWILEAGIENDLKTLPSTSSNKKTSELVKKKKLTDSNV